MTLATATRDWLTKHGLEGFLRVADAPPHEELEKFTLKIDLEEISKGIVLIGLPAGGLHSMEKPSTVILTKYFGEYSIASKAYKTQGGENPLFQEVACVLLQYGFVHPCPPAMPKNRAGFIIATFEFLKVDWQVIIADSLRAGIASVVDEKKVVGCRVLCAETCMDL